MENRRHLNIELPEGFDPISTAKEAKAYFKQGYNCCQAVVLAYSDIIGLDRHTALAMTSGFGGGMARLREVCGSVSGMNMVASFAMPATDPSNKAERTANYALIQEVANEFRKENGSIVCKELLGLVPMSCPDKHGIGKPCFDSEAGHATEQGKTESPEPSDRTEEYYKKRPCADLVECAARIVGAKLLQIQEAEASR